MSKASHQPSPLPFNSTLSNRKPRMSQPHKEKCEECFSQLKLQGVPDPSLPSPQAEVPGEAAAALVQKGHSSLSHVSKFLNTHCE